MIHVKLKEGKRSREALRERLLKMGRKYDIRLTDTAKEAGLQLAAEGKGIRFGVSRSGCCAMAVSLYPDVERMADQVIDLEGVPVFVRNEYPEMNWSGLIDYKPKGLHKGFQWRSGRSSGQE